MESESTILADYLVSISLSNMFFDLILSTAIVALLTTISSALPAKPWPPQDFVTFFHAVDGGYDIRSHVADGTMALSGSPNNIKKILSGPKCEFLGAHEQIFYMHDKTEIDINPPELIVAWSCPKRT